MMTWRTLGAAVAFPALLLAFTTPVFAQNNQPDPHRNQPLNAFSLDYEYEDFDQNFESWQLLAVELSHRFGFGSVIGRVNDAERFGSHGDQVEIDAYPSLGKGTYAYLNVGHSNDSIFPRWRGGAEIYRTLPHSFEASLGFRRLLFSSSDITLYTGSVGKYKGNYWISLRPYISTSDSGTSSSGTLTVRRYFADADTYIGFDAGYGEGPEPDIIQQEVARLRSLNGRISSHWKIRPTVVLLGRVGYRDQEFLFGHRRSVFAAVGIEKRF